MPKHGSNRIFKDDKHIEESNNVINVLSIALSALVAGVDILQIQSCVRHSEKKFKSTKEKAN